MQTHCRAGLAPAVTLCKPLFTSLVEGGVGEADGRSLAESKTPPVTYRLRMFFGFASRNRRCSAGEEKLRETHRVSYSRPSPRGLKINDRILSSSSRTVCGSPLLFMQTALRRYRSAMRRRRQRRGQSRRRRRHAARRIRGGAPPRWRGRAYTGAKRPEKPPPRRA